MTTQEKVQDLFKSIKEGNGSRLKSLLQKGCDPDACRGNTPALIYATLNGRTKCVEILIHTNNVTLDKKDMNGKTALMIASIYGRADILTLLYKAGANLNLSSKDGMTACMYAAKHDKFVCLEMILDSCNVDLNQKDQQGDTALIHAIKADSRQCVKYLIRKGVNINVFNNQGQCPLYIAIYNDNIRIADILIEAGASINIQDNLKYSPLSAALNVVGHSSASNIFQLIEKLLVKGAKPTSFLCKSSLHEMIVKEKFEIVRLMVMNGFRPVLAKCVSGVFEFNIRKPLSPLSVALLSDSTVHIAKYLIANSFFTTFDVKELPYDHDIYEYLLRKSFTKCLELMKLMFSSPLHLATLSLIKVSDNITYGYPIEPMPSLIERKVFYQTNRAFLCPHSWADLQLDFSSQYCNDSSYRIVLECWPLEEPFTKCTCISCSKSTGYKPDARTSSLIRDISHISL